LDRRAPDIAVGDFWISPLLSLRHASRWPGFQLSDVEVARIGEIENWKGRVSASAMRRTCAGGLGQRPLIVEGGIEKVGVIVEVVVDGVILAAFVFAAVAEIDAGDAEVIDKDGVVRTRAERGIRISGRERISVRIWEWRGKCRPSGRASRPTFSFPDPGYPSRRRSRSSRAKCELRRRSSRAIAVELK